jgi:hypothetical protein
LLSATGGNTQQRRDAFFEKTNSGEKINAGPITIGSTPDTKPGCEISVEKGEDTR